jgi:hypothetical protein
MLNPLDALRTLQENLTIAVLRRPSLSWTVKGTGLNERHFPPDLGPAFHIAMTKSQDEIHRVVLAKDARIWPLYGKRIIEWTEGRAREAARHIVRSMECSEDYNPVSTAYDDSSVPVPEVRPTPIHEQPEQRALLEKTLAAILQIFEAHYPERARKAAQTAQDLPGRRRVRACPAQGLQAGKSDCSRRNAHVTAQPRSPPRMEGTAVQGLSRTARMLFGGQIRWGVRRRLGAGGIDLLAAQTGWCCNGLRPGPSCRM